MEMCLVSKWYGEQLHSETAKHNLALKVKEFPCVGNCRVALGLIFFLVRKK